MRKKGFSNNTWFGGGAAGSAQKDVNIILNPSPCGDSKLLDALHPPHIWQTYSDRIDRLLGGSYQLNSQAVDTRKVDWLANEASRSQDTHHLPSTFISQTPVDGL